MPGVALSVVAPVFNEAQIVRELLDRIVRAVEPLGTFEVIVVDDGSTDGTWDVLVAAAPSFPGVRLVRLSRNFGHQVALTAGLDLARGDAVVTIDGDLQDPPEVIPDLVAQWRDGYDVVYGVRASRAGESRYKLWTARLFYRGIRRMSPIEIPEDAGDFRLLSRRAADALRSMPEQARFLRGMSSWIGYRQVGVPYERDARRLGETKYPTRKMLGFAADAVTSFSTTPLRLVSAAGFAMVGFCAIYLGYTLVVSLFTDNTVQGWASVIVLVLLIGGVQLLSLGVIGEYVARIFDEVKERPLYVVSDVIDSPGASAASDDGGC